MSNQAKGIAKIKELKVATKRKIPDMKTISVFVVKMQLSIFL